MLSYRTLLGSLAVLLLAGGCELAGGPSGQGSKPEEAAPSAVAPGGCNKLCKHQARCLSSYHRLGGKGFLAEPLAGAGACAATCERTARDPLLGKVLSQIIDRCAARAECDSFLGCSMRQRLLAVSRNPWMKRGLGLRAEAATVRKLVTERAFPAALRHCDALDAQPKTAPRRELRSVRKELRKACVEAIGASMKDRVERLRTAIKTLALDTVEGDCRTLARWSGPSWLSPGAPARDVAKRAKGLCVSLTGLRPLALALRDVKRDIATVEKALANGRADDALYYKCAHKGTALTTLSQSRRPVALRAAAELRKTCFERFAVAFLTTHHRAGARFDTRHCFKVKRIRSLMKQHASPAIRKANTALLMWAQQTCP